ncbi:MAG: hypothetical protein WCS94_08170 [Verrucomicrobiota bacterium]
MNDKNEIQIRLVELLSKLTALGKAAWVQSGDDPGTVYCRVQQDLIIFEVKGGSGAEPVKPCEVVNGVVCKFRNASFLWLEGLYGWDDLISMLKNAPDNHKDFIQMRRDAQMVPIRVLENAIHQ